MEILNTVREPDFRLLKTFALKPGDAFVAEGVAIAIISKDINKFTAIDIDTGEPFANLWDVKGNVLMWRRVKAKITVTE